MLRAAGDYILPEDVPANEFLNLEGQKMSTSRRWSLEMYEYLEALPDKVDELRYALISNLPENKDADFSWKDFQLKVNSELVAIVGNMVNRVFVLTHKFYEGKVPKAEECSQLKEFILERKSKVSAAIENYSFREALVEAILLARHGNKILTEKEPWKVVKTNPEEAGIVLYDCFQIIANFTILIEPFLPITARVLWDKLNMQCEISWDRIGDLQMVPIGSVIKDPFHLFSKMEDDVIQKQIDYLYAKTHKVEVMENQTVEKPEEKLISFDDFSKMDIRIGTILTAERVEGTDKLMKLSVDIGFEVRTIVSGIAHAFSVEDVVNKRIQVLANLAPRKIKGIESKGMILFADNGESLAFVSPLGDVPNGAGVK